ncbi:50S ribosomal protein L3 [Venenivibrio stagnispumantis]|uniref:Large ribosomal subunit protein uL3 n=1 Tax=Venenivibrio stagnispumantis TaxID=407998 RepID=A0AA45WLE0_9AQUI|nr:50S ribosomal protein L3 [Venenivibrio stagnispumantis]MCW4573317.1 50S ribosomal protein L3 [Venenivibrio stagnispumantis]SMP10973.1 LSU ribosomal protein L3P [Venenivibrio stagnispumantis]
MPKGIIGKKIGMTRVFIQGKAIPVTVIEVKPNYVVRLKTEDKDGYNAVVLGTEERKEKNTPKPLLAIFKKANLKPLRYLREFPLKEGENLELGQEIKVENVFEKGDLIDITGKSKGRGFTSVMKRWDFAGFPRSHGHRYHRAVGSIGCRTEPGRVWKTKRMAGHYGNETVTVLGLEVVDIIPEKNVILVKGSVPGHTNSILTLKSSVIADRRKGKIKLQKSKAMYA